MTYIIHLPDRMGNQLAFCPSEGKNIAGLHSAHRIVAITFCSEPDGQFIVIKSYSISTFAAILGGGPQKRVPFDFTVIPLTYNRQRLIEIQGLTPGGRRS